MRVHAADAEAPRPCVRAQAARPGALMAAAEQEHAGQTSALIDAYNAHKRPHSLLEAHQMKLAQDARASKKSKKKKASAGEPAGAAAAGEPPPWRVRAPRCSCAAMHACVS
jgi:hypothetical protein